MTTREIMSTIDTQRYQITCARTVLKEAQGYFENREERKMLPLYSDTIDALLSVVDDILYGITPKLEQSAEGLLEHEKLLQMLK